MSDIGCLMTDPMMRAVLSNDKDVTRRIGKTWARAKVGDRLWFREVWRHNTFVVLDEGPVPGVCYRSDYCGKPMRDAPWGLEVDRKWRSSLLMPRSVCRATGIITSIGRTRLHDIDDEDALREGMGTVKYSDILALRGKAPINELRDIADLWGPLDPVERFIVIFDLLNPGQWPLNPLVWRVEWRRE